MYARVRLALALVVLGGTSQALAQEKPALRVGVLGDSYSDEYQFYPPDRSVARNWVEILAETRRVDFGQFSTSGRGEPRNQGYSYNWARSDATTDDMIVTGQHTGVAEQVARGEVDVVVIFIGGNDFIGVLRSPEPWSTLGTIGPRARKNLATAVQTILDANPKVQIILATVPEVGDLPEFRNPSSESRLPEGLLAAVSRALAAYNNQIRTIAVREPRVTLADLYLSAKVMGALARQRVMVAGRSIDRNVVGNTPEHLFLADRRHSGTVGQGLLAKLMVEVFNTQLHAGIKPLTDQEVVEFATDSMTRSLVANGRTDRPDVSAMP